MQHRIRKVLTVATAVATAVSVVSCSSGSSGSTAASSSSTGAGASSSAAPTGSGAVGSGAAGSGASVPSGPAVKVKLQLQWFNQAQFGGYLAALDKGFYTEQGLDVTLLEGGTTIVPQTVLAQGQADYAIAWVPKALQSREQGAGMTKSGLDPAKDVTLVQQQFDENALLNGDIDAAQAMIYNEYAQVLEAKNPKTGKLYTPADFGVLKWTDQGTSMLQDAVWANTAKLADPAYQATTVKFLTASFKGWIYCASHATECRDIVVKKGSKLGASHQLWQMNEVSKLIWPSPAGIGIVNQADWDRTVKIAQSTKNADGKTVLTKAPGKDAFTNVYAKKAIDALKAQGADVTGSTFKPHHGDPQRRRSMIRTRCSLPPGR